MMNAMKQVPPGTRAKAALLAVACFLAPTLPAQTGYHWTHFAGLAGGSESGDDTGAAARLGSPRGAAVDGSGNLYVADADQHVIRRVTPAGIVTTVAGSPGRRGHEDGPGAAARFHTPQGVAVDPAGNVYVADTFNSTIRKITAAGIVSTLAGNPDQRGSTDGDGPAALFRNPAGVTVDAAGVVYVADTGNSTIRRITPAGAVTTLAGSPGQAASDDGTGSAARFSFPRGIAVADSGDLYIADTENSVIRKVTPSGEVSTLAGSAGEAGTTDGPGSLARFRNPRGIAIDDSGRIYIADTFNSTIRWIDEEGVVHTLAGNAGDAGSSDGSGVDALFFDPQGIAVGSSGAIYVADTGNQTIRTVSLQGAVLTLAGAASQGGEDGEGAAARFDGPREIALDGSGHLHIADRGNHTIRKATPQSAVVTLAGTAGLFGANDGTGPDARFDYPEGLAVDTDGTVYVAESSNHTIRKISPSGMVTTLAGSPGEPGDEDGEGSQARFREPQALALGAPGILYVADTGNHRIRRVTSEGTVTTIAGSGAPGGANGNGTAAAFSSPRGLVLDGDGNLLVSDTDNHRIRKIAPNGEVTDFAGTGQDSHADGPVAAAGFSFPLGLAWEPSGTLFIADSGNHVIRRISEAGNVDTVGGFPGVPGNADGAGTSSRFRSPGGVAIGPGGILFVSDEATHRISQGVPGVVPPSLTTAPASGITLSAATGGGVVTGDGGAAVTERGIVYSTSPGPTLEDGERLSSGSGPGEFSLEITGLNASTTYYLRAYAINSAGAGYGEEIRFTTPTPGALPPTVTTAPTTGITTGSAISGGTVTNTGGADVTERGVVYSTTANPTPSTGTVVKSGSGPGEFTVLLTGLTQSTTYHLRAYALNTSGIAYGSAVEFTTGTISFTILANQVPIPAISGEANSTTFYAITVPAGLASLSIGISGGTGDCDLYVRRGEFPTLTEWDQSPYAEGNTETAVFQNPEAGTYYIMLHAYAAYSGVTLLAEHEPAGVAPPTVSTLQAGDITARTATAGGEVVEDGGATVTARGIVHATSTGPTLESGTTVASGSGPGTFQALLTGLTPDTVYFFRAFATNSSGTTYGPQLQFTTGSPPPPSLESALDGTGLVWSSGGSAPWRGQNTVTSDGISAAASGAVGDGESSEITTTVTGPGALTFRWKVSSETGSDFLQFLVSGVARFSISGEVDWEERSVAIPSGRQTLKWVYRKDASGFAGDDSAWLDRVRFVRASGPLTVVTKPRRFAATSIGRQSRAQTLRITNRGGTTLTGLRVIREGSARREFVVVQPAKSRLTPGASTTFRVSFRPRFQGIRKARLKVVGNAPAVIVPVVGSGFRKES